MQESKEESKSTQKISVRGLLPFLIPYGICLLFSLIGVILGAINFAAGPIHYLGVVLVIWFLIDIVALIGIILNLVYFGIVIGNSAGSENAAVYALFIGIPVAWGSIALLVGKHFGWFSACELAVLVACGVIDVMISMDQS